MLYIVNIEVFEKNRYRDHCSREYSTIHLVEADYPEMAKEKLQDHYEYLEHESGDEISYKFNILSINGLIK